MGTPDLRGEVAAAVRALARLQSRTLPVKAGARAVALVKERFREEGFAGQKWQEPFRRRLSFRGAEGRNRTLTGLTGHLRDSTYAQPYPGKVYIRNQADYGPVHDGGGSITVTAKMKRYFWYRHRMALGLQASAKRGKGRGGKAAGREADFWRAMALKREGSAIRMPRRRFMGPDRKMEREIRALIEEELNQFIQRHGTYFGRSR